jgi:hypothetical protein
MIKAEVLKTTLINSVPKKVGDIVQVDEDTFRNLKLKGVLKAATPKPAPAAKPKS